MYRVPDLKNDCDFYQPAWQTLLFLTQADDAGHPRFLSYTTPDDLLGKTATFRTPSLTANELDRAKRDGVLRLAPRLALDRQLFTPVSIRQATSRGVLVDRNGHPLYYAVHLNRKYEETIDRVHLRNNVSALPTVSATEQFGDGTIEIKSAWQVASANEDTSRYFTARAFIAKLRNDASEGIVVDPSQGGIEATVKLVGIHIVFTMPNHPEFIWATFEHVDNAPDLATDGDPSSNAPVDATRDWSFYVKGTPAKNANHKPGQGGVPPLKLDDSTQTLTPVASVFRQYKQGGETDPSPNAIDQINESVHKAVAATALGVWNNYVLIGATWMNRPDLFAENHNFEADDVTTPPDPTAGSVLGGDVKLSNSVIETFTQSAPIQDLPPTTPQPPHRGLACFGCHRTTPQALPTGETLPALRLSISQSLVTAYSNARQASGQ